MGQRSRSGGVVVLVVALVIFNFAVTICVGGGSLNLFRIRLALTAERFHNINISGMPFPFGVQMTGRSLQRVSSSTSQLPKLTKKDVTKVR